MYWHWQAYKVWETEEDTGRYWKILEEYDGAWWKSMEVSGSFRGRMETSSGFLEELYLLSLLHECRLGQVSIGGLLPSNVDRFQPEFKSDLNSDSQDKNPAGYLTHSQRVFSCSAIQLPAGLLDAPSRLALEHNRSTRTSQFNWNSNCWERIGLSHDKSHRKLSTTTTLLPERLAMCPPPCLSLYAKWSGFHSIRTRKWLSDPRYQIE